MATMFAPASTSEIMFSLPMPPMPTIATLSVSLGARNPIAEHVARHDHGSECNRRGGARGAFDEVAAGEFRVVRHAVLTQGFLPFKSALGGWEFGRAAGKGERELRLERANGNGERKRRTETATGNGDWKRRMETANGNGEWKRRMEMAMRSGKR